MENLKSIFSKNNIAAHSGDFNITYLSNYYGKKEIIDTWIERGKSGRLDTSKEEEIKSLFINDIFGNILGFRENTHEWLLREEAKTKSDGTKPDAALGYFTNRKDDDDVRAIIEIKGPKADLDKKDRKTGKSPIDQAFEYAPKMDRKCTWVIVSNIWEIRFYSAGNRNAYQCYKLNELSDTNSFSEFLFLFHKDNFILRNNISKTDRLYELTFKSITPAAVKKFHIIDQMYHSLKRFEGLHFVDPKYLSNLKPFNILEEYVWHYSNRRLFTLNTEIFDVLKEVDITEGKVAVSSKYESQLKKEKVSDYLHKLTWIFEFLNKSYIKEITAIRDYKKIAVENRAVLGFTHRHAFDAKNGDGITKNILVYNLKTCDCMSCNFKSFDFKRLFDKLKIANGNFEKYDMELAYGNYLVATGNFKNTYSVLRRLEKYKYKPDKSLDYFLVRLNLKNLHNLIESYYDGTDKQHILKYLLSIDTDHLVHYELEYSIDSDVRNYLIRIKEDRLIQSIKGKITELNEKALKLKECYDNGGRQVGGLDLAFQIQEQHHMLYLHINRNFIIQDVFRQYQDITKDVISCLVTNHETAEVGLSSFNDFFISEAILHISTPALDSILKNVKTLKIDNSSLFHIAERFCTFLKSFYTETRYAFDPMENSDMVAYSQFHNFEEKLCRIFTNTFTVFLKSEITTGQFSQLEKPLLIFLKLENMLAHYNLKKLCHFIKVKGSFFSKQGLTELLCIAIERDKYGNIKYNHLIKALAQAIHQFYPDMKISNKAMVRKAIANCASLSSDHEEYRHIIFLLKIADDANSSVLLKTLDEYMSKEYNPALFEAMLRHNLHTGLGDNHFRTYLEYLVKTGGRGRVFKEGKSQDYISDFTIHNFRFTISSIGLELKKEEIELFSGLPHYERWLIDPHGFDYDHFEVFWLSVLPLKSDFVKRLSQVHPIRQALEKELESAYNESLAAVYIIHFMGNT